MIFGPAHNIRFFCAGALAAVACVFCAAGARGSIIVPEADVIDVDELLADVDGASSSKTLKTAWHTEQPLESPSDFELGQHLAAALTPLGNSASNTSTSSTSGSGGLGNAPIHSSTTATMPDLELIGWTNGEARFALPTPPGNDLLRPPRSV